MVSTGEQSDRTPAVVLTGAAAPSRSARSRRRPRPVLSVVVVLVALLFLAPFGYLVLEAIGSGSRFVDIITSSSIRRPLANSLVLAGTVSLTCAAVGTLLAVLVMRTDLPWRGSWRLLLALPLVMPSFVAATAFVAAFGRGGLIPALPRPEGFWGAYVVLTLLSYPYVYLPVVGRLSSTSPSAEEASRLLGRGPLRTLLRVLLPQLRPAVLGGALLVFLYVLSDFGAVSLLRYDTITRVLYASRLLDPALSLTLGLLLGAIALAVALAAARIAGDDVTGRSRAGRLPRYALRRWRWPSCLLVALPVAAGLAAPVAVFVVWVVRGSSTVGVGYSGLGDDLGFLAEPTLGSSAAALAAAVAAMVVVLPVAYLSVRRATWWTGLSAAVVSSVFALPGIVVALALVAWAVSAPRSFAPLYQSFPLLILGYVLHFGAQSLRSSQAAIGSVPAALDESASVLGAGARRRFVTIDLPLILPGVLAGGGLVLLSTLKELPATLLLAPTGFETLATTIWNAAEDGFYAEVGIASLVLLLLSALLTWILVLRPAQRG